MVDGWCVMVDVFKITGIALERSSAPTSTKPPRVLTAIKTPSEATTAPDWIFLAGARNCPDGAVNAAAMRNASSCVRIAAAACIAANNPISTICVILFILFLLPKACQIARTQSGYPC